MSDPHKARKAVRALMKDGQTSGVITVPVEVMFLTLTGVDPKAEGLNTATTVYGGEPDSALPPVGPNTPERKFYSADDGKLESRRDPKSFAAVMREVNRVWATANIVFKLGATTSGSFIMPQGVAKIDDTVGEKILAANKSSELLIRLIMVPMLSRNEAGQSIAPYRSALICDRAGPITIAHELGHIFGLDDLNDRSIEPENVMDGNKRFNVGTPLKDFIFVSPKMARTAYCSHNAVAFGSDPISCDDVYQDPNIGAY